ncbi:Saccharopine dehydrogenase-domain-containing protein [Pseudomassariella vexata]|uniref:Saccharopine dehydrogenase-domain-containing protein n=1 Tax=Pseudomassariella vexata TaxID=1141098 RepID=A0A1Y2EDF0_9PEZI|nr:Saccharopine dehydrogenase-domain-containing protein [Pseudomassariella vexata]ORY69591.1 Saccharopine dehydrogenase-domain-containing protein [Pseudomassariella vexata]
MSFKKHGRQYDVVVFGATGYTGLMTAEHISSQFPTDTKWAVAGRSEEKLKKVVSECKALNPDRVQPEIEICNLNDADLLALAKKTFVLITTVGPYACYGEHAFKACAEAGTHYLDCTGEAVWSLSMIKIYEAKAKETGAMLFPQSGIESAPSDILTWSLAQLIRSEFSAPVSDVVVAIHELRSAPSGGTLATVFGLFEMYSPQEVVESHRPYALSPVPNPQPEPSSSLLSKLTGLYTIPNLGLLHTSITAGTNAAVVQRSWGLFKQEPSRQQQFYGPKFTYREFMKARNFLIGMAMHYGLIIGGVLLMFVPPFRRLMRQFVFQPGQGPDKEEAAKDYIEFRAVATPDVEPSNGKQATVKAWYAGSMYYLTATFLAQGAATILQDDLKLKGGIYTPACLGQGYVDRLNATGFKMETRTIDL